MQGNTLQIDLGLFILSSQLNVLTAEPLDSLSGGISESPWNYTG